MTSWRQRDALFYQRLGTDPRVTIVGHDLQCDCVWALSVQDMQRFGIRDIEAPADYEKTDVSWAAAGGLRFLPVPSSYYDIKPLRAASP